ncbi:MAG: YkgJ family cysteine cluster protein [Synergistaceae bacterium]|nr:YkgJ family cysteine cluster protein [Synergistaceae bacterium]
MQAQNLPEISQIAAELNNGSGTCKYFDSDSRLCRIYDSRPIICNNKKFYEQNLKNVMTREKFDEILISSCESIRSGNYERLREN